MKKRKGSLLQRMMAVLLSAVLVAGMLSNAAPVTVLAQETAGQQENTGGSGTEPAAGDTKPEEKTETAPAEGTGFGGQEETDPEGQEKPGTTEGGGETEKGDGLTGQEPGGGMEEKPQEPGGTEEETETETVSGNDTAQEAVAKPQRVVKAAAFSLQAGNIVFGEGWVLDADGKLIIASNDGVVKWKEDADGWPQNRQKVTALELGSGVTTITDSAFANCTGLTAITIPGTVTSIGKSAFATCEGLTSITIPNTVTSIGMGTFAGCDNLTSVTLPDNMTSIVEYMFGHCSSLTNISLPESVTSIGKQAFVGCGKLQEITIPKAVMEIGGEAFRECFLLESITFSGGTPPTLGFGVFGKDYSSDENGSDERCGFVKNGTQGIHVPDGKAQAYKDAWTDWAAYIADDTPTPPTEEHKHNDVTFTAWTATDSLPPTAGNYYLTENVTLSETWNVPGETTLCLNGKTISASGTDTYRVITIPMSCTLNLYDCQNAGNITGGKSGGVRNIGTFCMYGGKISGNNVAYEAGGVYNGGTFYMYGGEISGNTAEGGVGGVETYRKFYMYGGKIRNNERNGDGETGGGGVCINAVGSFTVGGSAVISENTCNGKEDNVYLNNSFGNRQLITIDSSNPLSNSANIGVTSLPAPTDASPVNITGENGADYSQYFQSDNPDYVIVNGENNVVQLAVKPHTHNLTRVDAKTATCTEDGNTAYYTCDGCDKWFSDEEGTQEITDKKNVVIPAAEHAFDDIEWGYKVADGHAHNCKNCDAHDEIQEHTPGDAATESTPQTCTECGYIMNPAIGHTCNPRLVEKKEPDCTTAGKEAYYHCEGCGKYYEDEAGTTLIADISAWGNIAAPGHDWGEWTVTKPATATTPGEKERICKRCNEKETEIIPKKGDGSGGNSGGGTSGGSDDNSGGNSGDNGGNNGSNQDSSGNGSGSSGGNGNVGGSTGNTGGTGAGTSQTPGAGQPKVKQEKEGNIRKEVRVEGESTLDAAVETPLSELADMVLTKEEKQKAAGGTDVKVVLDVKDASTVVSTADKALVEKALDGSLAKGYTLGQYLDISLYKVVGSSRNLITETNGKIRVMIDVPDSLKNTDAAKTRTFAVIRVHDGKAELLADLDDNADTITIETDRFSTYAVVYKDTAGGNGKPGVVRVSANSDGKNPGGGKDGEPKTGDSTPLELSATLAMIAGFAYLLLYFADRERGMTEETKKELVSRMIGWAKQGGRIRKYLALAAIFALLVYYHSIGKKAETEWKAIYGE